MSLDLNDDDCQCQFAVVTGQAGGHRPGIKDFVDQS
jgi:hypothetical protein